MKHKPKKSLGQNFLKSELALKKIIEAGEISSRDIILEIGPGKGALTKKLLESTGSVIAVEKDYELFEFLKIKFEKEIKEKKLILLNDDILKFNISKISEILIKSEVGEFSSWSGRGRGSGKPRTRENSTNFADSNYKIIANIPYNITGAILKNFLGNINQPEMIVLMVQNEVAKRIVARDGKESILSISVKAYGEPKMIMKVPARYFSPSPKVDSAVISIKNISRKVFIENNINEKKFWEIIHAGFAHKRKKLSSNLKIYKNNTSKTAINDLENKRAEELTLTDWINLVKVIDINKKQ